jgi:hypothetical protein
LVSTLSMAGIRELEALEDDIDYLLVDEAG